MKVSNIATGCRAMVAIDFEDGTSALVSGFDETLMELGLSIKEKEEENCHAIEEAPATAIPSTSVNNNQAHSDEISISSYRNTIEICHREMTVASESRPLEPVQQQVGN
jgi:hypothetical protein